MIISTNHVSTGEQLPLLCVLLLLTAICVASPIHAATRTWDGDAGNGQWNTATNWSGNTLPGPGDDVVFNGISPGTITGGNTVLDSLTVSAGGHVFTGGTLVVGTVRFTGNGTINTLSSSWTASTIEVGSGSELRVTGGQSSGNLSILGTMVVSQSGIVDGSTLTLAIGRVVVDGANARLSITGGSGSGDIVARNLGVFRCGANPTTINNTGSALRFLIGEGAQHGLLDCATLNLNGPSPGAVEFIFNHATVGMIFRRPDGNLISLGGNMQLTARGGGSTILRGTHTYTGPTVLVGTGTALDLDGTLGNTTVTVTTGTALRGQGRITGPVAVQAGGAVLPGLASTGGVATLRFSSLDAASGSEIRFDLGTPDVSGGTTNDLIQIDSTATLAGNVRILTIGAVGSYPLFAITGSGSMNLPPIASMPNGFVPSEWFLRPRAARIDLAQRGTLSWQPNQLTFVATEGTTTTSQATIANSGPGFVDIAALPAPTDPRFTRVGGNCPAGSFTMSVGAAGCTVQYRFAPDQPGAFAATVDVAANAAAPLPSLALSGSASQRLATASPSHVGFGTVIIDTPPETRSITLTNESSAPVSILGMTVSPPGTFDVASTTCPNPLAGLGTCTITVRFTPTAAGADAAELAVGTGAGDVLVPMSATAIAAMLIRDGFEQ